MKAILTGALALAALTSAALADGAVELTDAQMDQITAGVSVDNNRARRPADDVVDTTRSTVPSGGARFTYFTPRIGGDRVANPGVNVARLVGNHGIDLTVVESGDRAFLYAVEP